MLISAIRKSGIMAVLLLLVVIMFQPTHNVGQPVQQITPTVSPVLTSTPTPTASPTPQPTPEVVTYAQMLTVNRDTLDAIKWMVTFALGLLTLAGAGALWASQRALQRVNDLQVKADSLKSMLDKSKQDNEDLRLLTNSLRKDIEGQAKSIEYLHDGLKEAQKLADRLHERIQEQIPRLVTLADVDTYAMQMFSANRNRSLNARVKLIEYSKDDDPVVRRECVRVFDAMWEFQKFFYDLQDPAIVNRLRDLALNDPERGVRLEAQGALRRFGIKIEEKREMS